MSEPSIAQISMGLVAAGFTATIGVGYKVLLKVTELTTLMSHETYGVIPRLHQVEKDVATTRRRIDMAGIGQADE